MWGSYGSELTERCFLCEDKHWHELQQNYDDFIKQYQDKKVVFIELGVGFNTPGIIRFPFEEMTKKFLQATLIRVNDKYADLAFEIQDDCKEFIYKLEKIYN